jgi:hypothetical protein
MARLRTAERVAHSANDTLQNLINEQSDDPITDFFRNPFLVPVMIAASIVLIIITQSFAWVILALMGGVAALGASQYKSSETEKLEQPYLELMQSFQDARYWHNSVTESATQTHAKQKIKIDEDEKRTITSIVQGYSQALRGIKRSTDQIHAQVEALTPNWKNPIWQEWRPVNRVRTVAGLGAFETMARDATLLGDPRQSPQLSEPLTLAGQTKDTILSLPSIGAIPSQRAVLFKTSGDGKAAAVDAIQSFLLRLIASLAPGKLRLTFIDPLDSVKMWLPLCT